MVTSPSTWLAGTMTFFSAEYLPISTHSPSATCHMARSSGSRSPASFNLVEPKAPSYVSATPGRAAFTAVGSDVPLSSMESPMSHTASYDW